MKRLQIFLLLIMAMTLGSYAKDHGGSKREKMFKEVQEFKMKYLAQEMNLTDDQKEKFFEVYSEMNKKREECFKEVRKLERKLRKENDLPESDYRQLTEARNKANIENAEIEREYDEKFSEFLSPKQIYLMKEGEKNFRQKIEEMRRDKKGTKSKEK